MLLNRIFSAVLVSFFVCASGAIASCPNDVYFRYTKTQALGIPVGYPILGDFDNDGKKDLVGVTASTQGSENPSSIVFYKGSANGFVTAPASSSVGSGFASRGIEMADVNGDGNLDVINLKTDAGNFSVYLGNGAGGFTLAANMISGNYFPNGNYGDLNGDGRADMLTVFSGPISYRLAQADGSFAPPVELSSTTAGQTEAADYNNDGKNDILVWNGLAAKYVLFNQGNMQFAQGTNIPFTAVAGISSAKNDLNGDGRPDIVTRTYTSGNHTALSVLFNQAGGGFTPVEVSLANTGLDTNVTVSAGDMDGDGDRDLVIFNQKSYVIGVNDGAGQFTINNYPLGLETANFIGTLPGTLEDFNGDNRVDLISSNRERIFKKYSDAIKFRENTCSPSGQTKFVDFDGDGQTDMGYFRASDGTWTYRSSRTNTNVSVQGFGAAGDIPAPQDYDGDSITDRAYFRPSSGTWFFLGSTPGGVAPVQWGSNGDKPVPSDYDGDGKADVAIYRPSNGTWWILNSSDGSYNIYTFGIAEDIPVPMDYDGDGKADVAVYRPSSGYWYIQKSTGGYYILQWGLSTDITVPGDYDNDGVADVAIYRPSDGYWYMFRLRDNAWAYFIFGGMAGDIPVPSVRPAYGLNVAFFRPGGQNFFEKDVSGPLFLGGFAGNRIVSTILPN
jgi:hypothetical protein